MPPREAAGQRTLNGVWLWGAGPRDMPLRAPARQVQADAPFTRGLARTAGAAVAPADRFRPHAEGGFAHVDSLHLPALRHDTTAWLAGLEALERATGSRRSSPPSRPSRSAGSSSAPPATSTACR